MPPARPTICLNMIVKNEARVIRRCLDSVKPFIDAWVIVDTGSTDGTQDIIREHLAGIPGALHERSWKDFGHNRTEALELAQGQAEYILIMDADEVMVPDPGFQLGPLPADEVQILHRPEGLEFSFHRTTLVRSGLPFRYVGVLHEVIVCDAPHITAQLRGLTVKYFMDSARNADPVRKYEQDAALLEEGLRAEPGNARYVFYLAQSYRDAGQMEKSLEVYRRRVEMGGWVEEVWYALYQIGVLRERLGQVRALVADAYLAAYQHRPARAEPLCQLARYHRERSEYALAYLYAAMAAQIPRPPDILFVDDAAYDWRSLDELSIAAYYVGRHAEGLAAAQRLLTGGKLPASQRARVEQNRAFCQQRLGAAPREKPKEKPKRKGR